MSRPTVLGRVTTTWLLGAFLAAAVAAPPRAAHADPPISSLDTIYMDVGYVQGTNVVTFGDGPNRGLSGTGLRYYERHCCLARFLAAISLGILFSAGAASPYKSIETKTYDQGDYRITETTYTYYTEEEKERNRKAAADATASVLMFPFTMELVYFPRKDDGELYGFQWSWYLYDFPKRSPLRFEIGIHWDRLSGNVIDPGTGMPTEMSYRSFGMPFRAVYRPMEWVQFDAEFRWNAFRGEDDEIPADQNRNQMFRGGLEVTSPVEWPFFDLFYGRVTLQTNNWTEPGKTGYLVEAGLRL